MSKTQNLLLNSGKIVGSGLAAMLLSHLANDAKIASEFAGLGIGGYAATEFAKLFVAVTPNYIVQWWSEAKDIKNHDKNHDIEATLKAAYEKTVAHIEDDFFNENDLNASGWRKLGFFTTDSKKIDREIVHDYFFQKLLNYFIADSELNKFISNNSQLNLEEYLEKAFSETLLTDLFSNDLSAVRSNSELILFFKTRFLKYYPQSFVQELKHNDKAKTAYFKILLELCIERLAEIKADTTELKRSTEEIKEETRILHTIALRTGNNLEVMLQEVAAQNALLNELAQIAPNITAITSSVTELLENSRSAKYWVPNLILTGNKPAKDKSNIFEYNTRYIPFLGRNEEIGKLCDFLDSPEQFSWWMLEGAGGMGKSRLAMELCDRAKKDGFYSGFYRLENSTIPDDDRILGGQLPMLIVIDYAMANIQKTLQLVRVIQDKINTAIEYEKPVSKIRILLLDRKFPEEWKNQINYIKSYCYDEEHYQPLQLQAGNEDLRWQIIEQVFHKELPFESEVPLKKIENKKKEILDTLTTIDSEKRPLYAFFAAETLLFDDATDLSKWNKDGLLQFHLNRLKTRVWAKKSNYLENEVWINKLLVLNTLCRSLTKEEITNYLKNNSNIDESRHQIIKNLYYTIADSGDINGNQVFFGLQPDILGEFYVLKAFEAYFHESKNDLTSLLEHSWSIKPDQLWWTLVLTYWDYFLSPHPLFSKMEALIFQQKSEVDSAYTSKHRAFLQGNIASILQDHPERAIAYLELIRQTESSVIETISAVPLAHALVSLTFSNPKTPVQYGYLSEIKSLYEKYNGHRQIAEIFATALYNMGADPDYEEITGNIYIAELNAIHDKFPENMEIALTYSSALYQIVETPGNLYADKAIEELERLLPATKSRRILHDLVLAYGMHLSPSFQQKKHLILIEKLIMLQNVFDDDKKTAEVTAFALSSFISEVSEDDRQKYLNTIENIYNRFTSAEFAFNLASALKKVTAKERTANIWLNNIEKIKSLLSTYPDNENIANIYAEACGKLIYAAFYPDITLKYLDELWNIRERFKSHKEIAYYFLVAITEANLTLNIPEQDLRYSREADEIVTELWDLDFAITAVGYWVSNRLYRSLEFQAGIKRLEELVAVNNRHPGNPNIEDWLLKNFERLMHRYKSQTERMKILHYFNDVFDPQKNVKAAKVLMKYYCDLLTEPPGEDGHFQTFIALKNIYLAFPEGTELIQQYATGLYHAVLYLESEHELMPYANDLSTIYQRHPGHEIALPQMMMLFKQNMLKAIANQPNGDFSAINMIQDEFHDRLDFAIVSAEGYFNLIYYLGESQQSLSHLNRIKDLYQRFPDEIRIARTYANSLKLVIENGCFPVQNTAELRSLNHAFENDLVIAQKLAGGLCYLYGTQDDDSGRLSVIGELLLLDSKFADQIIAHYKIKLLFESTFSVNSFSPDISLRHLQEIKKSCELFPDNVRFGEYFAVALSVSLLNNYIALPPDADRDINYIQEMNFLTNKFQDNAIIEMAINDAKERINF